MKISHLIAGIFFLIYFLNNVYAADLGLNPGILKLKVYKFAVSTSVFCTNLTTVIDNGNTPTEVDFVGGVDLGSGAIAFGTYPCVVVEFSSIIKFRPDATSTTGNCNPSSADVQMDVCGLGSSSVLIDGSTTTCTNNSADRVAMYISTTSTGAGDAFNAPTIVNDTTKGINLGSALVVSSGSTGLFVVDGTGKVCDGSDGGCDGGGNPGVCRMEQPTFSFE
jgi:hypothetical protein